jgi:hypothetical protein
MAGQMGTEVINFVVGDVSCVVCLFVCLISGINEIL